MSSRVSTRSASPRRSSPAAASTTASRSPSATRASLVPTLPRMSTYVRSGRCLRSWATRLGEPVPTFAPAGSSSSPRPPPQSASYGLALRGTAAVTSPGTPAVGRSFSECTAKSQRPSRIAVRSAAANTPSVGSRVREPRVTSPSVRTRTSSTVWPSARSWSATSSDCVTASCDARVPRRSFIGSAPMPRSPARSRCRRSRRRRRRRPAPRAAPRRGSRGSPARASRGTRRRSPRRAVRGRCA